MKKVLIIVFLLSNMQVGNIGISIALNIQKTVHNRIAFESRTNESEATQTEEGQSGSANTAVHDGNNTTSDEDALVLDGSTPTSRSASLALNGGISLADEHSPLLNNDHAADEVVGSQRQSNDTRYLSDKWWWLGMAIMLFGETGNFAAYGFAPAILVAPLGTVTLISNALIAPIFLGERLYNKDIGGIVFVVIGTAIMLAVSSQTNEPSLSPDDLIHAMLQFQFIVYFIFTFGFAVFLITMSYSRMAKKFIFVDLLIVSIFGGYTVLATKGLSSMLKTSFVTIFTHWITYFLIIVLLVTAVMQVQYLNRALALFDSVEVIPTNFVLFTSSSIIGSSIMYNDLKHTNSLALLGVISMFFGVSLITNKSNDYEDLLTQPAGSDDGQVALPVNAAIDSNNGVYESSDGVLSPGQPKNNEQELHVDVTSPKRRHVRVPSHPVDITSAPSHLETHRSISQSLIGTEDTMGIHRTPSTTSESPVPASGSVGRNLQPHRRPSIARLKEINNKSESSSTFRKISSVLTAVGTHKIRQMEFDMMSELNQSSPEIHLSDSPRNTVTQQNAQPLANPNRNSIER